ncbi:MAG TPA: hypothetical protein VKQ29_18630 [Aliidongia sp.]|nr:hypothetical protein [Aliidongia sp.]
MPDKLEQAAMDAIASVLEQLPTMRVEEVTFTPSPGAGSVARVRVQGGHHEILCELSPEASLTSVRVIEL